MVGIVVVSHSYALAEEVIKLSLQMAQSEVKVLNAGGTNDGRFGTDATKIMSAVMDADSGDGVVILVDLGSAVMSAELALELLDADSEKVKVANAALLEGCIASVTAASIGLSFEQVLASAEEAMNFPKVKR